MSTLPMQEMKVRESAVPRVASPVRIRGSKAPEQLEGKDPESDWIVGIAETRKLWRVGRSTFLEPREEENNVPALPRTRSCPPALAVMEESRHQAATAEEEKDLCMALAKEQVVPAILRRVTERMEKDCCMALAKNLVVPQLLQRVTEQLAKDACVVIAKTEAVPGLLHRVTERMHKDACAAFAKKKAVPQLLQRVTERMAKDSCTAIAKREVVPQLLQRVTDRMAKEACLAVAKKETVPGVLRRVTERMNKDASVAMAKREAVPQMLRRVIERMAKAPHVEEMQLRRSTASLKFMAKVGLLAVVMLGSWSFFKALRRTRFHHVWDVAWAQWQGHLFWQTRLRRTLEGLSLTR